MPSGEVDGVEVRGDELANHVGMGAEECTRHHQVGRLETTARPQGRLVDEDDAARLVVESGQIGLGHPGAVDLALLEELKGGRIVGGDDAHVAAPLRVGLQAVGGEPGAQGDVLGVAELGCGQRSTAQVGRTGDVGIAANHQAGAPRGDSCDDAQRLAVALDEGVDCRARPDEGGVERPRQERGDRRRPGIEGLGLQGHSGAEVASEDPLLDADQGGRVSEVREVPEPKGRRRGARATRRRCRPPRCGRRAAAGGDQNSGQYRGRDGEAASDSWDAALSHDRGLPLVWAGSG